MKRSLPVATLLFPLAVCAQSSPASYFPPRGNWQHRSPAALGLDSGALTGAIRFAGSHLTKASARSGNGAVPPA